MRAIILVGLIFLLLSPVYASGITIEPGAFTLSMYGGETICKNLTITATGFEVSVVANISAEIKANQTDLEGFEINFSESRFILDNNQPKVIQIEIYAVPNLMPDSFEIEIIVKTYIPTEIQTVYKSRGGGRTIYPTRIVYIENLTNQTTETIFVPYNWTTIEEIPVEEIINDTVNQTIYFEDIGRIKELEIIIWLLLGILGIIGIIILIIYFKRKTIFHM